MKKQVVLISLAFCLLCSTVVSSSLPILPASPTGIAEVCDSTRDTTVAGNPGDILYIYDVTQACGEQGALGVDYDGQYIYVTGFYNGDSLRRVYFFQKDGTYLSSAIQPTIDMGWRDLAFDGEYMYSSCGPYIDKWTVTGLPDQPAIQFVDHILGPLDMNRGLAYDPSTDHFWTANWRSQIFEIDRNGNIMNTYENYLAIFGMAWDSYSIDGPWLWVYTQDYEQLCNIAQFNPRTGEYTGVEYTGGMIGPYGIAGGLACYQEGSHAVLLGLTQNGGVNDTDVIFGMEVSSSPLSIKTLRGGLGISSLVENTGETDLSSVTYELSLEGGLVLFPGAPVTGSIDSLPAGDAKRIHAFALGFGHTTVTLSVQAGGLPISKSGTAMMLGPFIIFNKEGQI